MNPDFQFSKSRKLGEILYPYYTELVHKIF